jgi:CheY-like chemotaxis protein
MMLRGNEERSPPMRVLLVEDDAKITAFVTKGFRQEGFAVDRAADGVTGLELALTVPYDAAVIDLMLPHGRPLRRTPAFRRCRAVGSGWHIRTACWSIQALVCKPSGLALQAVTALATISNPASYSCG